MGNVGWTAESSGVMHRTMFMTGGAGIPCGSGEQQRGGVCGCEEPGMTARNGGGNGACR